MFLDALDVASPITILPRLPLCKIVGRCKISGRMVGIHGPPRPPLEDDGSMVMGLMIATQNMSRMIHEAREAPEEARLRLPSHLDRPRNPRDFFCL